MSVWESKVISLFNMKFPEKLWLIVNDCDTGAIGWGLSGDTIALEYDKFQEEYLDKDVGVFKTNNIASFVRQLNLYGFRKCNRYNDDKHEFKHPLFVKGRKDLIQFVKRKPGSSASLNSSARTPRRSKVKTNTDFALSEKENTINASIFDLKNKENKHAKTEGCILKKDVSKATPKRTPLSSHPSPNMLSSMGNFWWNNISSPYPSNSYCDRSIVDQGWLPVNGSYYNSQTFIKREPGESEDDENEFFKEVNVDGNQFASKNNGNMFYLVVPGYPSAQSHDMYVNPGYYGGMFPFPGMPLGFNPNYNRSADSYLE